MNAVVYQEKKTIHVRRVNDLEIVTARPDHSFIVSRGPV
jgi:hypothetical protein